MCFLIGKIESCGGLETVEAKFSECVESNENCQ